MTEQVNSTPAEQPAAVTVQDLLLTARLLEDLANMKRLSTAEIEHIKPSFDRIVAFLKEYEKAQQAQAASTETNLLDLSEEKAPAEDKPAKKKAKKKA